jgi:hypothetical protein
MKGRSAEISSNNTLDFPTDPSQTLRHRSCPDSRAAPSGFPISLGRGTQRRLLALSSLPQDEGSQMRETFVLNSLRQRRFYFLDGHRHDSCILRTS